MDVQRTCLLIGVSYGAQKITGSGFMDVQRTCLVPPAYPTILTWRSTSSFKDGKFFPGWFLVWPGESLVRPLLALRVSLAGKLRSPGELFSGFLNLSGSRSSKKDSEAVKKRNTWRVWYIKIKTQVISRLDSTDVKSINVSRQAIVHMHRENTRSSVF